MIRILIILLFGSVACNSSVKNSNNNLNTTTTSEKADSEKIENYPQIKFETDQTKEVVYSSSVYTKIYGNGVLVMNFTTEQQNILEVELLNEDGTIYAKWNYKSGLLKIEQETYDLYEVTETEINSNHSFHPREFFPEYEIIHFDVMDITEEYYEVLIEPISGEKKKIKKNSSNFTYYPWPEYIKTLYIDLNTKENPLKQSPSQNATIVSQNEGYYFKAIEVQGEWIKVECDNDCRKCDQGDVTGWVKWKEGKEILIDTGIIC